MVTVGVGRPVVAWLARPSAASVTIPATPAAVTLGTPAAVHPIVSLLAGVLSVFGLNSPTAPANPLGELVWGLFRKIETAAGLTPKAGTTSVSAPDPTTGLVTGSLGFSVPAGLPLTLTVYTNPTQGSVTVDSSGAYYYTPSQAARLTATATTTDTFTVTASDGLAATNHTVTVPVDAGTPVPLGFKGINLGPGGLYGSGPGVLFQGSANVGSPDANNGAVPGSFQFSDPAGRTLTYSGPSTSTGGGTVILHPSTGLFTYIPTQAQLQAAGPTTTDTFTVTASNGVNTASETITVPVAAGTSNSGDTYVTVQGDYNPGPQYLTDPFYLYSEKGTGEVKVINCIGDVINTITVGKEPTGVAVAPVGTANAGTIYVANNSSGTISVINPAGTVTNTITVGANPYGVAIAPAGAANAGNIYVANHSGTVSVINPAGTVIDTITVGPNPVGVAIAPAGTANAGNIYVTDENLIGNAYFGTVSVINPTGSIINTIPIGEEESLWGVAVAPAGAANAGYVYVANYDTNKVSVINTAGTIIATIAVGQAPAAVAVAPAGTANAGYVYVINSVTGRDGGKNLPGTIAYTYSGTTNGTVSVINTAGTVINTVTVGVTPLGVAVAPPVTVSGQNSGVGVFTDPNAGDVYVTSPDVYGTFPGNGTISVINSDGTTSSAITASGWIPGGIAVAP